MRIKMFAAFATTLLLLALALNVAAAAADQYNNKQVHIDKSLLSVVLHE